MAGRPAQQTVVLAKSTKLGHGTKLGRTLCYFRWGNPVVSIYVHQTLPSVSFYRGRCVSVWYVELVLSVLEARVKG